MCADMEPPETLETVSWHAMSCTAFKPLRSSSQSTPTMGPSQPIPMVASHRSSLNLMSVRGLGRPASINNSRNEVSRGDREPPSIRETAARAARIPGVARWRSANDAMSVAVNPVTAPSASRWATAASRERWRARSSPVRAGVVTRSSPTLQTSPSPICSSRTTTPGWRRPCLAISSIGTVSSIHCTPCSAAAARPATMPFRPVHSQAATVLVNRSLRASLGR